MSPGEYRAQIFTKTIYDPNIISNAQMAEWGSKTAAEAMSSGRINGNQWEEFAPNGLKFVGFFDEAGAVKNYFPTLK